ncbi:MAG: hypothetical protein ACO1O6_07995 [Bacteroidota bacterium]
MKRFLILPAAVIVVLLSSAFYMDALSSKPGWLDGEWHGKKYQVNMDKGWETEMKVDTKTKQFSISYPELSCKGTLELQNLSKSKAVFIEKLPNTSCLSEGYIIVTKVDEKHVSFTCLRDREQRLASYCTLERVK